MKKQIDWNVGDLISNGTSLVEWCGIVLNILPNTECNIKIHWFKSGFCGYYRGSYHKFRKLNA